MSLLQQTARLIAGGCATFESVVIKQIIYTKEEKLFKGTVMPCSPETDGRACESSRDSKKRKKKKKTQNPPPLYTNLSGRWTLYGVLINLARARVMIYWWQ